MKLRFLIYCTIPRLLRVGFRKITGAEARLKKRSDRTCKELTGLEPIVRPKVKKYKEEESAMDRFRKAYRRAVLIDDIKQFIYRGLNHVKKR